MSQIVHVCFAARFIVVLCLGFIFLLMCNELFTSKADDVASGCVKEGNQNMAVDYTVTLLYFFRYCIRH